MEFNCNVEYQIDFYNTRGYAYNPPSSSQTIHSNTLGKLKPHVPNLDNSNPDYAYKISYLGHYKNNFNNEDSAKSNFVPFYTESYSNPKPEYFQTINISESCNEIITLFPNPCNNIVTIGCKFQMNSITITDINGCVVYSKQNISSLNTIIELQDLFSGIYFVFIETENTSCIFKIIVMK